MWKRRVHVVAKLYLKTDMTHVLYYTITPRAKRLESMTSVDFSIIHSE